MSVRLTSILAVLFVASLLAEGWGIPAVTVDASVAEGSWEEGPVVDGIPMGDDARRMRVPLTVTVPDAVGALRDVPVTTALDLVNVLADGGWPMDSSTGAPQGFTLDMDSVVVHEVNADGSLIRKRLPVQVFPGSFEDSHSFDPTTAPRITLRWIMEGDIQGGQERHFFVYFDSLTRGSRTPATYPGEDLAALVQSGGPGVGTHLYVPFYSLPHSQGDGEQRKARIVNLVEGENTVRIREYTQFGVPQSTVTQQYALSGTGDARTYTFGNNGDRVSSGRLLIESDAPVFAEVFRNNPSTSFIPAADGGMTGTRFVHNPHANGDLYIMCSQLPCKATISKGGSQRTVDLTGNQFNVKEPVQQGVPVVITTDVRAAVQYVGGVRSPTAWPSLTPLGPLDRSHMMGFVDPGDGLMVLREEPGARLFLQQDGHGSPRLTESSVPLPDRHLKHATVGTLPLGSSWDRWDQKVDPPTVVRAEERSSQEVGGLHVVSGPVASGSGGGGFSALVTPESSDGGLSYTTFLPGGDTAFGRIVIFAAYPGTTVTADRHSASGVSRETLGPLSRHEVVELDQPGYWEIHANRPVMVSWLHRGAPSFGGLAAGVTQVAEVAVGSVQFAGPVFDVTPTNPVIQARPGQLVEFQVQVRNLGRTVDGTGIQDVADLNAQAPSGWNVQVVPLSVVLEPEAVETVRVTVQIPANVDPATGGATLRLEAVSQADPSYVAQTSLRVNFVIHRDVEVTVNHLPVEAQQQVLFGETATYIVRVTNRGGLTDSFRLEASPAVGPWNRTFSVLGQPVPEDHEEPEWTPLLSPGESAEYELNVRMTSESASRLITHIQATSGADRSVRDTARAVTSFAVDRSFRILVEDPVRLVSPGDTVVYNVTVFNEADVNEQLHIEPTGIVPAHWPSPRIVWDGVGDLEEDGLNNTIRLDPQTSVWLLVSRPVPENASEGELAVDRLRFRSAWQDADEPGTDILLRTTADRLRGITARFDPATMPAVAGQNLEAVLRVESQGNTPQRLNLEPVTPEGAGWTYRNDEDEPPPWVLEVKPGEVLEFPVYVHVPFTAPPATQGPIPLRMHLTAEGVPDPRVITGNLEVAERVAARVEDRPLVANPGRWTDNPIKIHNDGNVPLTVEPRIAEDTLPPQWRVETQRVTLPVAAAQTSPLSLHVPADTREGTVSVDLEWVTPDGRLLASAPWTVHVGVPMMSARVDDVHAALGSLVIPVWVTNEGRTPVFNVSVELISGGEVLDRQTLHQVLPEQQAVAPLVAPREGEALRVRVTADHDPQGIELDPSDAIRRYTTLAEEEAAPGPGALLFAAVLIGLVLGIHRRRRKR